MKNKGFTLIELLAVIAILAIISIIAVPIVLNVIGDAEHELDERSIENYMRAVELAVASKSMDDASRDLDGIYIIEGNKIIQKGCKLDCEISVDVDENVITTGTVIVEQEKVKQLKYLDKKLKKYVNATEEKMFIVEDFSESVLITGSALNGKMKQLANDDSFTVWSYDDKVKSVEFLSFGQLPDGYTLETLKKLKSLDVSNKQDGSIIAYYDSTIDKVYIYSEGLIVFNSSCESMFMNMSNLSNVEFGVVDSSNVTTMGWMFGSNKGNSITKLDLSMFDTSKVTSMRNMFYSCGNLNSVDLSSFNTSKVTNMSAMFSGIAVEQLDLSNFDTSKVTNMELMFSGCRKLKSVDLSSFDTSSVTNMGSMFRYSNSLEQLDLSNFDTSKVTNMGFMFDQSGIKSLNLKNLNTSNVTSMSNMFSSCKSLTELDLSSFDTSSVTTVSSMFASASNLKLISVGTTWNLNREGITGVDNMFNSCGTQEVTYK